MSKEFSFPNSGTCSKQTNFVLNDDHTIESMEVIGGCNGNLKGSDPGAGACRGAVGDVKECGWKPGAGKCVRRTAGI